MNISDRGLSLILEFEGKLKPLGDGRYVAYRCPAGVWTIYAGCTDGVHEGQTCTEDEGREMFRRELDKHERIVSRLVTVDLTQGQFDSLVSFSYNCGGLAGSTLLRKLNSGDVVGASNEFRNWTKAKDPKTGRRVELAGLVRRRKAEAALFVSDLPNSEAMPQAAVQARRKVTTAEKVAAGAVAGEGVLQGARQVVDKGNEIKSIAVDARGLVPSMAVPSSQVLGAGFIVAAVAVVVMVVVRARG